MVTKIYDRKAAAEYAKQWALFRNLKYADFENMGGDCTNFVSQCLYHGSGIMNYTPIFGWFYNSVNSRAPAWTGVEFLYNFLIKNDSVGPYGEECSEKEAQVGDIIQLNVNQNNFHHSAIIDDINNGQIFVSAHTYNVTGKPLSGYMARQQRFIHILGVRNWD